MLFRSIVVVVHIYPQAAVIVGAVMHRQRLTGIVVFGRCAPAVIPAPTAAASYLAALVVVIDHFIARAGVYARDKARGGVR